MADKTAREVVEKALRSIGYIAAEEAPTAVDYTQALDEYMTAHEVLDDDLDGIEWNYDAVPQKAFSGVSAVLSGRLIREFPTSAEAKARALENYGIGMDELRKLYYRRRS